MRSRLTALALATALALPAAANAYSNIYYFGDSLSDVGAFGGQSGLPAGARWTTGYGPNWTNVLSGHFGLQSVANNPLNATTSSSGNNYAQGGAVAQTYQAITQYPNTSGSSGSVEQYGPGGTLLIQELPQQTAAYLASTGGKADPNAVYSVWIGGNDVIAALGTASSTSGQQLLGASAQYTAASVQALVKAGAKNVIVPNLPNMGAAPLAIYASLTAVQQTVNAQVPGLVTTTAVNNAWVAAWQVISAQNVGPSNSAAVIQAALTAANTSLSTATGGAVPAGSVATAYNGNGTAANPGVQPSLQQLAAGYNQLTDMTLSGAGVQHNIVRPNISLLFQEILANPGQYGFTNTIGSACATSAIQCAANTLPGQSYVFTDQLHPTPAAQQIIGDYVYGLLQAPYYAAALPDSALNNARQLGGALDSRYQAIRSQKRAVGTVSAFVDGAFNDDKIGYNNLAAKPKGQLYTLGLDYQASPALSIGVAMSRQQGKTDISSTGTPGSVDDRTTLMSGLVSYNQDKFWIDGDVHIGSGDLDTSRAVTLGPTQVQINGSTRQTQYGLRIGGGYRLQYGNFTTGPVAGLDYAHVKVAGFAEQGGSSSMAFGGQNASSLVGRVGWQLDADVGKFSPYAKVSFAHEFQQDDRNITAGLTSTLGDWTTNIGKADANWMEWTAGVSANFSKTVTAYGQFSVTSGRSGGNQTGGNLGVAVSF
ncbi:autotransporter outer membrane beta-barrel domain-containing protein [Chromobacterium subtsugae]|uniref:autotransporter outer membrane beta-barrel domain-containing protein n=1 Tax=Chromobacterium subtsugae TaxID=251747 RepID=UPI0009C09B85|nr:autotransporter domain-containing protein [Chromobacterium subtsugae]